MALTISPRLDTIYAQTRLQWDVFMSSFPWLFHWITIQPSKKRLLSLGLTLVCLHFSWEFLRRYRMRRRLKRKRERMMKNAATLRAQISQKGTTDTLDFLANCTLDELQTKLRSGAVTPTDLLHAFQSKVLRLVDLGNSGVCELIMEAEQYAIQQEKRQQIGLSETAPLCGIPVSLKELCSVKGYDATFGLVKLCEFPAVDDCVVVKALRHEGAIPFVLTATSQLALATCGFNPVAGRMVNPHSPVHEPGGSTSGEAVLLSQHGSIIGLGTDIGGSIRIPAAFCGLTGLKPTSHRVSSQGLARLNPESAFMVNVCVGPMARRVNDLAEMMRTLLRPSMFKLDPTIPPMPFNERCYAGAEQTCLTIGYFETLNHPDLLQTVPSIRRAISEAVTKLTARGHRLIKFNPPEPFQAMQISLRAMSVDGGRSTGRSLDLEPLSKHTKSMKLLSSIPKFCFPLIDYISGRLIGPPFALTKYVRGVRCFEELRDLAADIVAYRAKFASAWEKAGPLDALLCPVSINPAPSINMPAYFEVPSVLYTLLYNVLDYPAGTVPVGSVNADDIEKTEKLMSKAREAGEKYMETLLRHQLNSEGLPLGVQVVGRPFQEELVLRVMRELETA